MILASLPLALALAALPLQEPEQEEVLAQNEVEITYLANEGFLLRSGKLKVLIDAFVGEPYGGYESLPPDMLAKLTAAAPPFDGTSIMVLTSHAHKDHFQPKLVEEFLLQSPGAAFVSSTQVVNTLAKNAENFKKIKPLCGAMPIKPGASQKIPRKEMTLEFLNLPHGGEQNAKITNYGHLMRIGDLRILHVGDADTVEENFAPYDLANRDLDIVFVPYWYFSTEEGVRIIDEHFKANYLIACHFPMSEKRQLSEKLLEENPHVLVFDKAGDKKVFQGEKKE